MELAERFSNQIVSDRISRLLEALEGDDWRV